MKVLGVQANNRKRTFEVRTRRGVLPFPYSRAEVIPSSDDPIRELYVDREIGRHGFTYVLESGAEGTILLDHVLEHNEDPSYMANVALYRLTLQARDRFKTAGLSAREIARLLGTSPAQLYRLLDQTNYKKSMSQMLALLHVLGFQIDLELKDRKAPTSR